MEKDADRIAGFKAYLYEEKNIRNKKFVEPKQNKQSKEQNNSNTQTLVIQKKQEEMRLRA